MIALVHKFQLHLDVSYPVRTEAATVVEAVMQTILL